MAASPTSPVDVVVRFSTSNPDVVITFANPENATGLSLKQQIRQQLDEPTAASRLRLIHAGKVLSDTAPLSTSLHITAPPPSRNDESRSEKAKGKQPVRDIKAPPAARVYIHCSVGDTLTPAELAKEIQDATEAENALQSKLAPSASDPDAVDIPTTTSTTPAPRGFDRLLSAGFTQAEVASLRTQFLAIQAHTHTPDTMPSGPELLALEERWLDSGSNAATAGSEDAGGFGSEDAGGLEDMLYGNLIGFFWPVGAMCWLMREEGVWSRRRQIAVLSGFLVNITFGFLRIMN
ncbi:hypothetical protein BAUCODRAFT_532297 [Baudoinia panamericana UAMH 10762]|uniref:Ubiquitin-like domain-containing protein n=1 Tax=Baudoinia panamericana (strain UAMH 10762) TaxID=717646 RepID=M2N801_BAUPA|nr:uncharacterized protein BAUCODRAFT_532297 [Baudoinia panamericana UAMH 10762]EMC95219.1 hypothetical protein BAUCODRAFT_532297 [Baudoinia panamericana UAMH 10762]